MLRIARSLLADPLSGPILVVAADKFGDNPLRSFGRITDQRMRDLFSDGAAAVVLDREAVQLSLLGFGFASEARFWNYYGLAASDQPPNDIEVMADSVTMFRAAFDRCLTDAKITRDEVALILFPLRGPTLSLSFARMLRFPLEKIFLFENAPTPIGCSGSSLRHREVCCSRQTSAPRAAGARRRASGRRDTLRRRRATVDGRWRGFEPSSVRFVAATAFVLNGLTPLACSRTARSSVSTLDGFSMKKCADDASRTSCPENKTRRMCG